MSRPAVRVAHLSKQYRIGGPQARYKTLRESITETLRAPRRLLSGGKKHPDETIWALQDVSFEIQKGEAVGIIGRNGAGKSTLLKLLSRITRPTSGRIELSGRVGSLLEVGTGFHPELTGRDNIYLNGAILGMHRHEIERKFDEIVAFSEIEKFLDTPVKRYSSGMYMRLAFAVAAHLEPEILVVDEVLAVGDAAFQKKCLGKMSDVAHEGRTVLFVSHNMTAVQSLCSRAFLLEKGSVVDDGPSDQIVGRYLSGSSSLGQQAAVGIFDLTQRKNALTPGKLVARGIRIEDHIGNLSDSLFMGKPARFIVDLDGFSDFRDADIGLMFKTSSEQRLTTLTMNMSCSYFHGLRTQKEMAILNIPRVPFMPGTYWVDLSIAQRGIGRVDFVENAAKFDVVESDVYGTGYQLSSYFGHFYLDGSWEISGDDRSQ